MLLVESVKCGGFGRDGVEHGGDLVLNVGPGRRERRHFDNRVILVAGGEEALSVFGGGGSEAGPFGGVVRVGLTVGDVSRGWGQYGWDSGGFCSLWWSG